MPKRKPTTTTPPLATPSTTPPTTTATPATPATAGSPSNPPSNPPSNTPTKKPPTNPPTNTPRTHQPQPQAGMTLPPPPHSSTPSPTPATSNPSSTQPRNTKTKKTSSHKPTPPWGPLRTLLVLLPVLLGAPWIGYKQHRALPVPVGYENGLENGLGVGTPTHTHTQSHTHDPTQISESRILDHVRALSAPPSAASLPPNSTAHLASPSLPPNSPAPPGGSVHGEDAAGAIQAEAEDAGGIAYRIVGTLEHAHADAWAYARALELRGECARVAGIQRARIDERVASVQKARIDQRASSSSRAAAKEGRAGAEGRGGKGEGKGKGDMGGEGRVIECEVWRQVGSGSHRFDIMNTRLYKTYVNLTNIVVRISSVAYTSPLSSSLLDDASLSSPLSSPLSSSASVVEDETLLNEETPLDSESTGSTGSKATDLNSKEDADPSNPPNPSDSKNSKLHAVLVNAHLDSTLPSPGAADDALAVGVMLECIRVLLARAEGAGASVEGGEGAEGGGGGEEEEGWVPEHAIVFLFNNAEESLQDGSHLFATQHEVAGSVRAVINLEAAGTKGREILFQATSEQMIEAYSHVPRPFGTIFANDIFSSGMLQSDTDFRQFQQYLNVTGLDMAVIGNGYLYHMRKDIVENIEPGVAQNMAENTLALLLHLSSSSSPLPSLTEGYTRPTTVYFSLFGVFWIYSFRTAKMMYSALLGSSIVLVAGRVRSRSASGRKTNAASPSTSLLLALTANIIGWLGSLIIPNVVALIMVKVLGKGMSWFRGEFLAVGLYGGAGVLGALIPQLLLPPISETAVFSSVLLLQASIALAVQLVGIGSASLLFVSGVPIFVALALDPWLPRTGKGDHSGKKRYVGDKIEMDVQELSVWTYALAQGIPGLMGMLLYFPVAEVFIPLMGRVGADAPVDNVVATLIPVIGGVAFPLVLPFAHRFGKRALVRGVLVMTAVTAVSMAYFAGRDVYDEMHQKRMFVLRLENITSGEHHLHLAASDGAPGFEALVDGIADTFGGGKERLQTLVMNDHNADWDSLYPFSLALSPYKLPLAIDPGYVSPWASSTTPGSTFTVTAVNDVKDLVAGTRSLTIKITHPGIIWTVIAFDAHVLEWNLDDHPPDEYTRHHIKEASFYGVDTWTVDLVIKLPSDPADGGILVNFIGLQENGMWPAKRSVKEQGGLAMELFEKLDAWLDKETGGTVDATLMGGVTGVAVI